MNVSIELPETKAIIQLNQNYFKKALTAILYYVGKLSEKEACSVQTLIAVLLKNNYYPNLVSQSWPMIQTTLRLNLMHEDFKYYCQQYWAFDFIGKIK